MDAAKCQKLLNKYATATAYIVTEDKVGDQGIGSAFHVGEGVFVTARHVVENRQIAEIRTSEFLRIPIKDAIPEYTEEAIVEITEISGSAPTWPLRLDGFKISDGPYFHQNEKADVAVFRVAEIHPKLPFVPLGSHLDDWIVRMEWRMSEAIILGYPLIPFTTAPELVAARAEINAIVWTAAHSHANFILSAMPRGGFSGGLALHEHDFALGVIAQSLTKGGQPAELGFLSVLSIEPIYECLADNKLLPECQKEAWVDFWNIKSADFVAAGGLMVVSISHHDDGKRFYFDVMARDPHILKLGINAGLRAIADTPYDEENLRDDWIRVHLNAPPEQASSLVESAARAAEKAISDTGLKSMRTFSS